MTEDQAARWVPYILGALFIIPAVFIILPTSIVGIKTEEANGRIIYSKQMRCKEGFACCKFYVIIDKNQGFETLRRGICSFDYPLDREIHFSYRRNLYGKINGSSIIILN